MPGQQIRGDYEQLANISKSFSENSETIASVFQSLQQKYEVLAGGEWIGEAADNFFAEHEGSVKPALQKLIAALQEASKSTSNMSNRLRQAEEDASGCIRNAIRF